MTLYDLAAEVMDDADGNLDRATERMVASLQADPRLFRDLVMPVLLTLCRNACRDVQRRLRGDIVAAVRPDTMQGYEAAEAADRRALLEFPLPSGIKIAEATKADLADAIGFYYRQARDMMRKRQWFVLLQDRLPDEHKRVGDVLTERELEALYREASRAFRA